MITLVTVLESWRSRYGLSTEQWLELAEQVSLTVDLVDHRYPPMHVDLADKLGVRRFEEAVARVLNERLGGGVPGVDYGTSEEAKEAVMSTIEEEPAPPRTIKRRRCSSCSQLGHYSRTCPRFPRG